MSVLLETSGRCRPLVATGLAKAYDDRPVLTDLDLVVAPGRRLGVVGENGAGKSTLLRLLAGAELPDRGSVTRPPDLTYLPQEPVVPAAATVSSVLAEALRPLHEAVAELEGLAERLARQPELAGLADEYAALLARAEAHDAWGAPRRAEKAAARLGLDHLPADRPVASLSGGQRARLALAAAVTLRPTCLLLDEPTNHLDDAALAYLEEHLADLPGVVVVASHDRVLLERTCTALLDLDPAAQGAPGRWSGSYRAYLAEKRRARQRWEQDHAAQQEEITRLRAALRTSTRQVGHGRPPRDNDKFLHYKRGQDVARTVSRRVRDAGRRLEELERDQLPRPPAPLRFRGELGPGRGAGGSGGSVQVRELAVAGRLEVARIDVPPGGRLLLTGGNGSGKSTLLKVLAGDVRPTAGTVQVTARRLGHLPQEVCFRDPARTAVSVYAAAVGPAGPPLRELGLLHPRDHGRPVGLLSHGQQRRLALAVLVARAPDLLLLDEPTNHLSLALADELEEAVQAARATVLVASHDRWLRRRWTGEELRLEETGS